MSYLHAKRIAKSRSIEYECVQHVNRVGPSSYIVSDWYDCDRTVISYENGKQL